MDSNIDASQQRLLDVIYDLFRQRGTWPTFAVLDRKLDQDDLDAEGGLGRLPKGLLRGYAPIPLSFALTDDISLTLTGVAAAASSGPDLELLAAFIRWLAERERDHDPEASGTDMTVDSDEALAALGISTDNPMAESLSRRPGRPR